MSGVKVDGFQVRTDRHNYESMTPPDGPLQLQSSAIIEALETAFKGYSEKEKKEQINKVCQRGHVVK